MKKLIVTALTLAIGLFAADGYAAGPKVETKPGDRAVYKMDANHLDSKKLIGMRIKGADGKDLGEIDQLIVDTSSGKITHAIVGLGGVAGVGEKHVVVPWSELKFTRDGDTSVVMMERAKLEAAPRYTRDSDRDRVPAASPATAPRGDRDRDGVSNKNDRAPDNPKKQ